MNLRTGTGPEPHSDAERSLWECPDCHAVQPELGGCGRCPGVTATTSRAERRYWLRRSWTRLWWVALDPDEALAMIHTPTHYRARTRDRLLAKLLRMNEPKDNPWEEIRV